MDDPIARFKTLLERAEQAGVAVCERRFQQPHLPPLEVLPAEQAVRPPRYLGDRLPLPDRCLQVQPYRAPALQRDLQELAGIPPTSYETVLNYIRTTETATGLSVSAYLVPRTYVRRISPTNQQMRELSIQQHPTVPKWNYTITPR